MCARFERIALAKFIAVGCAAFFGACGYSYAQYFEPAPPPPPVFNPSYPYTVPQPTYKPLSPAIPSTLLGTGANSHMDGSLPSAVTHSCQIASNCDPPFASKAGSDLLLMKFAGCDVLILGENQHHASIVAAILIGTQRFCC